MLIRFQVAPRTRCDLVTYSGVNLTGRRGTVRIWPSGSVQGRVETGDLQSMVIRAPHGTRVILCTHDGPDWEAHPWRCVRLLPGSTVPSESTAGFPGVRLPDLDLQDPPSAKRTQTDMESSYPLADRLADGTGWTFGRVGDVPLKDHVVLVVVEPDVDTVTGALTEGERVARAVLEVARAEAPAAFAALVDAARQALPPAAARSLGEWVAGRWREE